MFSSHILSKLDRIGMTASTICAIHCAAVPLLITSLPLMGLSFLANPLLEWSMIGLAFVIGVSSISISYFSKHHRPLPLCLLIIGFVIILFGHAFIHNWLEMIIVPAGGLCIAYAHFINYKFAGMCNTLHQNIKKQES
ncbi:MAG TPA: MerC domain-containing protein [Mucilaginibacter sp.]